MHSLAVDEDNGNKERHIEMAARREIAAAIVAVGCFAAALAIAASALLWRRSRRSAGVVRGTCLDAEEKPQRSFKRVLADNSYTPFKHFKQVGKEEEISLKTHPYEEEITSLLERSPTLLKFVTHENLDIHDSYVWIDTEDQLEHLAQLLSKEQAFAVDTEQHSLRSFLGFTALMQISTQKEDFLLDTIALHDAMGILHPVFANPSICKVFHGADNDVLWLQRDFHLYVVNMFDTAKACQVLSKPSKSLAYLLETYCGVTTDKTLQRKDWRTRPLSEEMIQYARSDAHYLLYIADCLATELQTETLGTSVGASEYDFGLPRIQGMFDSWSLLLLSPGSVHANIRSPIVSAGLALLTRIFVMIGLQKLSDDASSSSDDKLNIFFEASRRSNMVCMQLYSKEIESYPGASAAASLFSRHFNLHGNSSLTSETKDLIWNLCAWRDLMARIYDESLRFVLSDQAIVALATKAPKSPKQVHDTILQADSSTDISDVYPLLPSPSPVVSTHIVELCGIFQDVDDNKDDIFRRYLQNHLSCCPLSIYNYTLLSELNLKQTSTLFSKQNGGNFTVPMGKKASRELFVLKFSCKSPVYHNCRIFASDGRLLCYCDRRKLEWYVRRDLAKIVENDPPAIMLLFEPKGRPEDEDNEFYIHSKKNMCVGCGEKNHYLRYRIIPSCYRMHFPEHLKSHRSHDIVLLCVDCHEIAHCAAEKYKKQIAAEFGIPLFVQKIVDLGENRVIDVTSSESALEDTGVSPLQLRTAAMALLRHGSSMPLQRREELTQIVKSYFGGRDITSIDLEMALLVGMSPHERRRLEKKRGITLRRSEGNNGHKMCNTTVVNSVESDMRARYIISNSQESSVDENVYIADGVQSITPSCHLNNDALLEGTSLISDSQESYEGESAENRDISLVDAGKQEGDSSSETGGACPNSHQLVSSRKTKKLSLLGHGPHGKQVVEHLLEKYGENGILHFCQRWRQVFVEAIHPRFLPAGWDIMHNGRRDFGDYSVYNPAKKGASDS